jgi:hypothetical protein
VGEGDFQTEAIKQQRPKLGNLFALGDGVGGDESDAGAEA